MYTEPSTSYLNARHVDIFVKKKKHVDKLIACVLPCWRPYDRGPEAEANGPVARGSNTQKKKNPGKPYSPVRRTHSVFFRFLSDCVPAADET